MLKIFLFILVLALLGAKNPPKQYDYVLDGKLWYCSQYGSVITPSKSELGLRSGIYQWWVGKDRICVKYERHGSL